MSPQTPDDIRTSQRKLYGKCEGGGMLRRDKLRANSASPRDWLASPSPGAGGRGGMGHGAWGMGHGAWGMLSDDGVSLSAIHALAAGRGIA
jgi:hypothetical protein